MNNNEDILQRLSDLEKRIDNLLKKEKDLWDKIQIIIHTIGSILIPIAILLASHFLSREISLQQSKAAQTSADSSRIQASVNQALAVKDLVQLLTDKDSSRRELAIKSVEIALKKEDAEEILKIIAKNDKSSIVRDTAKQTLKIIVQKKDEDSFVKLFSSIKSERSQALNVLTKKQWESSDTALIESAINYANQNLDNYQGVINILYIFREMSKDPQSKSVLLETKLKLHEFLKQSAQSSDTRVKDLTAQVRSLLPDLK
jgi:HEAT repeat protein